MNADKLTNSKQRYPIPPMVEEMSASALFVSSRGCTLVDKELDIGH